MLLATVTIILTGPNTLTKLYILGQLCKFSLEFALVSYLLNITVCFILLLVYI